MIADRDIKKRGLGTDKAHAKKRGDSIEEKENFIKLFFYSVLLRILRALRGEPTIWLNIYFEPKSPFCWL